MMRISIHERDAAIAPQTQFYSGIVSTAILIKCHESITISTRRGYENRRRYDLGFSLPEVSISTAKEGSEFEVLDLKNGKDVPTICSSTKAEIFWRRSGLSVPR